MKILIVDDEVMVREMLHEIISRLGYEGRTAAGGREALNILKEDYFPIVISDVRMPEMSGIELLKEIKGNYPELDVIIVTGYNNEYSFVDVIKAGASDFITKPFSREELEAKLSRVVRERELLKRHKRIAEELKLSEKGYQNLVEFANVGIIITEEGKITQVNRRAEEIYGHTRGELIGQSLSILIPEKYREPHKKLVDEMLLSGQLKQISLEEEGLRKDGTSFPLEIAFSLSTGQEDYTVIAVMKDITERRWAEDKLVRAKNYTDNIIKSMADGLVMVNPDGRIERVNQATVRLSGYSEDELRGKPVEMLFEEKPLLKNTLFKTLLTTGVSKDYDMVVHTKQGECIPVNFSSSLMLNCERRSAPQDCPDYRQNEGCCGDKVTGFVGVIRDMRESRLLQELQESYEQLKQTQAQLMQSDKMASIGQLAAGVAHEINNPMGFIYSNLESARSFFTVLQEMIEKYSQATPLLEAGGTPECKNLLEEIRDFRENKNLDLIMDEFKDLIEESLEGAERVRKIVKDLKSFSHVGEEEWAYSDINECLESTLNIAWNEIKYKAEVNKDYGDLPELKCNGMQLNQVFLNILVNAAQAIEEKGTISIKTCADNGGISIEISDTGEGMSRETQSRLFEPFYTTKEVGKGTGLGLSMAYGIIRKHKGTITVESEIGKGTTFFITLPVTET